MSLKFPHFITEMYKQKRANTRGNVWRKNRFLRKDIVGEGDVIQFNLPNSTSKLRATNTRKADTVSKCLLLTSTEPVGLTWNK